MRLAALGRSACRTNAKGLELTVAAAAWQNSDGETEYYEKKVA